MREEKPAAETGNFQERSPRLALKENISSASSVINDGSDQYSLSLCSRIPSLSCAIYPSTQGERAPDPALEEDFNNRRHLGTGRPKNDHEDTFSDLAERDTRTRAYHNGYKIRRLVLAVVGMPHSGKSTFIQHALDLKKTPSSKVATKRVSLEGVVSIIEMREFNIHEIAINSDGTLHWPTPIADDVMGNVNGVLVIYNVENVSPVASIKAVPALLRAFKSNSLPTALVRCMCDLPLRLRQNNDQTWKAFGEGVVPKIPAYQVSLKAPESHKRCVSFILRTIRLRMNGTAVPSSPTKRPKTLSDVKDLGSVHRRGFTDAKSKHKRAQSEDPFHVTEMARDTQLIVHQKVEGASNDLMNEIQGSTICVSRTDTGVQMQSSLSVIEQGAESGSQDIRSNKPTSSSILGSHEPLVLVDEMDQEEPLWQNTHCDKDGITEESMSDLVSKSLKPQNNDDKTSGVSFDQLVDRLLSQTNSKSDMDFAAIFLCLYRRFVTPSTLLDAIISRFDNLSLASKHQTARMTSQLRYLNTLAQWITDYPGDFAQSLIRIKMMKFMSALADQRPFAMAVQEINKQLVVVCEDDDTAWACSDVSKGKPSIVEQFGDSNSICNPSSATHSLDSEGACEEDPGQKASRVSQRGSAASSASSSNDESSSRSIISSKTGLNAIESAQRQARLLTPSPKMILCKIHWNLFMEMCDDDIAQELTRIDWILFSSIRPRDLVRHVSLREEDKEKYKNLRYVSKMIHQFNHVACWTANMILLREKPKHRAKALEKCMAIAWKLRHLNNYNSLGAVVAGINTTAVHRLVQTRELIPYSKQKEFMRLQILMGTQKSHFAYRLAWSNTPIERIPFLPLHCRDLASAEEGNPTYIDEERRLINWKKFEIVGDVITNIQRSQAMPYQFNSCNEEAQRLILECSFTKDDDELYNRSVHLEGLGLGETTRKKFVWF